MPPHWQLMRFGAMPVPDFLASIDFFVYFTHPLLREGYGRAIAEAIAAGKLVITDEETAGPFGPGVVTDTGTGDGIDRIIASHVADPSRYAAAVLRTQADLAAYRPDPVAARLAALLEPEAPLHAVV